MHHRYKSASFAHAVRGGWAIVALLAVIASSSAAAREIRVVSGGYGNCGAVRGNATADLARQCDGLQTCRYMLRKSPIGAQSVRCRTDFRAEWFCTGTEFHTAALGAKAEPGSTLVLSCIEETGAGK
jgi:hypothetical protein